MGGAKVVPVRSDLPYDELKEIFDKINGFVIPGGSAPLVIDGIFSNYTKAGSWMIDMAIKANDKGDYFPVWCVCNGFELLVLHISDNPAIFGAGFNDSEVTKPLGDLAITEGVKLFSEFSPEALNAIQNEKMSYFHHHNGFDVDAFKGQFKLTNFFNLINTNFDLNNREFVSTIESKDYPIFGL